MKMRFIRIKTTPSMGQPGQGLITLLQYPFGRITPISFPDEKQNRYYVAWNYFGQFNRAVVYFGGVVQIADMALHPTGSTPFSKIFGCLAGTLMIGGLTVIKGEIVKKMGPVYTYRAILGLFCAYKENDSYYMIPIISIGSMFSDKFIKHTILKKYIILLFFVYPERSCKIFTIFPFLRGVPHIPSGLRDLLRQGIVYALASSR
jgi:hypothetical protein